MTKRTKQHRQTTQRFKDLMRNRRTLDQGLTFKQIFNEVYHELVAKYHKKYHDQLNSWGQPRFDDIYWDSERGGGFWKVKYLKKVMNKVRKTDDDFRHLAYLYVKRNVIDKNGRKVRPYIEHRYVNIDATETPKLLEEAHKIDLKHTQGCLAGLEKARQRILELKERMSTPEGSREIEIDRIALLVEIEFPHEGLGVGEIITELMREGRLPESYKKISRHNTHYHNIDEILKRELVNKEALTHLMRQMPSVILYDDTKRNEEIRKAAKDIIASTFDIKQFEKEERLRRINDSRSREYEYDWSALDYRKVKAEAEENK